MLDQIGLWGVSGALGLLTLFLSFRGGLVLRIILVITGLSSYILAVIALCKEVEFKMSEKWHRMLLAGPFIGILFSFAIFIRLIVDALGEQAMAISAIGYLVFVVVVTIVLCKQCKKTNVDKGIDVGYIGLKDKRKRDISKLEDHLYDE